MSYLRFEAIMEKYPNFAWEPLEVTTADDYILTLFHIWNTETHDSTMSPVLIHHGFKCDGVTLMGA